MVILLQCFFIELPYIFPFMVTELVQELYSFSTNVWCLKFRCQSCFFNWFVLICIHLALLLCIHWFWWVGSVALGFYCLKTSPKGSTLERFPMLSKKKKLSSALCDLINLQYVHQYASFSDMLGAESLAKVLPGVETIEEGNNFYLYWVSLPVWWYNLSGKWLELKFGHAAENILVTIKNQNFVVHNSNRNSNSNLYK